MQISSAGTHAMHSPTSRATASLKNNTAASEESRESPLERRREVAAEPQGNAKSLNVGKPGINLYA